MNTFANIGGIQEPVAGSVVTWTTLIAVDALGVVQAVPTDTTTFKIAMYVNAQNLLVYFFIIHALRRVTKTVTRWNKIAKINIQNQT